CILVHNAIGYRAVSDAELEDIVKTGMFRQGDPYTTYTGKWFTTTQEGAESFKGKMKNWNNPPTQIIKANIPDDAIERFSKKHDGISDSFYVAPENLKLIRLIVE
ncbi:MAG: hypothetical protein LBC20_05460, partial [Planctomycetaceae bacterium]|nr:hypothetical protein [Planctomycetaceae bacterium]